MSVSVEDINERLKVLRNNIFQLSVGEELDYAKELVEERFWHDKDFVLEAVGVHESCYKCCSLELRDDIDVLKRAIKAQPQSIRYASGRIKNDFEMNMLVVKESGMALSVLEEKFRDDYAIVTAALNQEPLAFRFVSDRFKGDIGIARMVVLKQPGLLRGCSKELLENTGFLAEVMLAKKTSVNYLPDWCHLLIGGSPRLLRQGGLVPQREGVDKYVGMLRLVGKTRDTAGKLDKHSMIKLIKAGDIGYLLFANDEVKNDIDVGMAAIEKNGVNLLLLGESMKSNVSLVKLAIAQNPEAYHYCGSDLKNDKRLAQIALRADKLNIHSLGTGLKEEFKGVMSSLIIGITEDIVCQQVLIRLREELGILDKLDIHQNLVSDGNGLPLVIKSRKV